MVSHQVSNLVCGVNHYICRYYVHTEYILEGLPCTAHLKKLDSPAESEQTSHEKFSLGVKLRSSNMSSCYSHS